jgi:antitoxin FitA
MATLTIRNLDDSVKQRLRVRAAQHGWSMEEEVRTILQASVEQDRGGQPGGLATRLMRLFKDVDTTGFELPERTPAPDPISFDE